MVALRNWADSARVMPLPVDRETIEATIERLIDLLDQLDGDADFENATDLEDDHTLSPLALAFADGRGAGCSISDPGEEEPDREQVGYHENDPRRPVYGINQTELPAH